MRLPRWYKYGIVTWLICAPAFWFVGTGFHGMPYFSLPQLNGAESGPGWQLGLAVQLVLLAALLFPLTALPVAILGKAKATGILEGTDDGAR